MGLPLENPRKNNNFNVVIVKMFKMYYREKSGGLFASFGQFDYRVQMKFNEPMCLFRIKTILFLMFFCQKSFFS
jgi:hypothetical protein